MMPHRQPFIADAPAPAAGLPPLEVRYVPMLLRQVGECGGLALSRA